MAWLRSIPLGIAVDRRAQQRILVRGIVAHLFRRASVPAPGLDPCVLVHPAEQRPGLRVDRVLFQRGLVVLPRPIEGMSRNAHQGQPLQADPLFLQALEMSRLDLQPAVEMLQRKFEALGLAQRLAGLDPGFRPEGGHRRLARQHQQVADASGLACQLDTALPGIVPLPELAHVADAQRFPVRLLQVGHQAVDRTHRAAVPRLHRLLHHLREAALVVAQRRWVGGAILQAVAQLAIGVNVEGRRHLAATNEHHATGAQRMADAQLVPDVGIVDGEIRHD